jgi:hypothetical protein
MMDSVVSSDSLQLNEESIITDKTEILSDNELLATKTFMVIEDNDELKFNSESYKLIKIIFQQSLK